MTIVSISNAQSRETYEAVTVRLGLDENPPDGMLIHTAGEVGNEVRIVDVWESEHAMQTFARERLFPAFAAAGINREQDTPAGEVLKAFDLVRPH